MSKTEDSIFNPRCPHCREKVRADASICPHCRSTLTGNPQWRAAQTGRGILALGTLLLVGFGWYTCHRLSAPADTHMSSMAQQASPAVPSSRRIPYSITRRWSIRNGGEGKEIVIAPADATFERLQALGDTLREDTKSDRNANTGFHRLDIYPDGLKGPSKQIDF